MKIKRKTILGTLVVVFVFIVALSIVKTKFYSKSSTNAPSSINESNDIKYVKDKMDEYKEFYTSYIGTDRGFDEKAIFEIAPELYEMSKAGLTTTESKIILNKYFDSIKWINRNGMISLSIEPSKYFRNSPIDSSKHSALLEESWQIILRNYSNDARWDNTTSMKGQYLCHASYANSKSAWNIEPHRTETDFKKITSKLCNP